MLSNIRTFAFLLLAGTLCTLATIPMTSAQSEAATTAPRVFEIRTYTTLPGRLDALQARFRDHTTKLFEKHGMTNVGYWTPADEPRSTNTLVYILSHASRDAAKMSWDDFINDPEWHKARDASEKDGPIVEKIESMYLNATDYSPLK
jgi:hypothetical protein